MQPLNKDTRSPVVGLVRYTILSVNFTQSVIRPDVLPFLSDSHTLRLPVANILRRQAEESGGLSCCYSYSSSAIVTRIYSSRYCLVFRTYYRSFLYRFVILFSHTFCA